MSDICKSCQVELVEEQVHSMKEISCPKCLSRFYRGDCGHCGKVRLIKHCRHSGGMAGHTLDIASWKQCETCDGMMSYGIKTCLNRSK